MKPLLLPLLLLSVFSACASQARNHPDSLPASDSLSAVDNLPATDNLPASDSLSASDSLPAPGWIVDEPDVLTPGEEQTLASVLMKAEEHPGIQMVGVVVRDLRKLPVATLARKIAEEWNVGMAGVNNGVMLLLAPNDQQLSIQIGRGMEWTVSDHQADSIRDIMIPFCRRGDYAGALDAGFRSIIALNEGVEWSVAYDSLASVHAGGAASAGRIVRFDARITAITSGRAELLASDGEKVVMLLTKHADISAGGLHAGGTYRFHGRVVGESPLVVRLLGEEVQ